MKESTYRCMLTTLGIGENYLYKVGPYAPGGSRAVQLGTGRQGTTITPKQNQLNTTTTKRKTPNSPTTNATARPTQTGTGTSSNAD